MKWSASDIQKLADKGMVKASDVPNKPIAAGITHIVEVLNRHGVKFEQEYRFNPKRRFRFDLYLNDFNVGIEYEGLMSEKSRHTTIEGYSKDAEKYNLAACNGIHVLRYTALNFNQFETDLIKICNK